MLLLFVQLSYVQHAQSSILPFHNIRHPKELMT
jgi:hypothetical protein